MGSIAHEFDTFCNKFPELSYPIISEQNNMDRENNLYYFQLDKVSSITEDEFLDYIRTSRWSEFQNPLDSSLYLYHYVPAGKLYYKSFLVLIVNCGYMPQPEEYQYSDIGAYENLLIVFSRDGCRIDTLVFSSQSSVSNVDGKFSRTWNAHMPLIYKHGTFLSNGKIVITTFEEDEQTPHVVENFHIDSISGRIIHD